MTNDEEIEARQKALEPTIDKIGKLLVNANATPAEALYIASTMMLEAFKQTFPNGEATEDRFMKFCRDVVWSGDN